jgi:hypothetical protein
MSEKTVIQTRSGSSYTFDPATQTGKRGNGAETYMFFVPNKKDTEEDIADGGLIPVSKEPTKGAHPLLYGKAGDNAPEFVNGSIQPTTGTSIIVCGPIVSIIVPVA